MAERHLAQAERHLATIGEGIARQRLLIVWLEVKGHDTCLIHALLATMKETHRVLLAHWAILLDEIAAVRSKLPSP